MIWHNLMIQERIRKLASAQTGTGIQWEQWWNKITYSIHENRSKRLQVISSITASVCQFCQNVLKKCHHFYLHFRTHRSFRTVCICIWNTSYWSESDANLQEAVLSAQTHAYAACSRHTHTSAYTQTETQFATSIFIMWWFSQTCTGCNVSWWNVELSWVEVGKSGRIKWVKMWRK